jgi:hypothetical protein
MNQPTKPDQLLLRFRASDTPHGISRPTLEKRVKEILPGYEADDGELSSEQLAQIRAAVPQGQAKSVKSSLF